MDARKESKLSSNVSVVTLMTESKPFWEGVPGIVKVFNKLIARMKTINTLELVRNGGTKGATNAKQTARDEMVDAAKIVAGAVSAYADDIGGDELLAKVEYTATDYNSARDTGISNLCQGIHDTASTVVDKLGDNGVTADTLTDLQDKIDDYGKVNGKPRATRSNSRAAGELQKKEFAAVDRLCKRQLDGLMVQFKSTQPEFYAAYSAARDFINQPGGHNGKKSANGSNGHDTPPTPQ